MPVVTEDIGRAAAHLRAGKLAAFPTETVYGLGADARNPAAVAALYRLKGRPLRHPLIVHLPDFASFAKWAQTIPPAAKTLAAHFLPGALTMILKKRPDAPDDVCRGQDTIALRTPSHPLAQALLREAPDGVAAPSANRFGRVSPTRAADVAAEFPDADDLLIVDGGDCPLGIESTILDLSGETVMLLRPGAVGAARIAGVLGAAPAAPAGERPRAPGGYKTHYAPRTPLIAADGASIAAQIAQAEQAGRDIAAYTRRPPAGWKPDSPRWRKAPPTPAAAARDLYRALRDLDAQRRDAIFAELPPPTEPWQAVADRLRRAAA